MSETTFMKRVEELMAETGCSRALAQQAIAASQQPRTETKEETVLRRAVGLMRNRGLCWSKAIDLAAQTVE